MVDEDESKNRKLRVFWRDFAMFGLERCAKATEGCRSVELVNLPLDLLGYELPLEVYKFDPLSACLDRVLGENAEKLLTVLLSACQSLAWCRNAVFAIVSNGKVEHPAIGVGSVSSSHIDRDVETAE